MLTDDELLSLAGKQAIARGRGYASDGRIALSRHDENGLDGEAEGSGTYTLWLKRDGADWRWGCACPASDSGAFCKHLVAAVLTAREESRDDENTAPLRKPSRRDGLADFLRAQTGERLAGWLLALAAEDSAIDKRVRLYRAADDPAELKAALGKMIDAGGFLDYHRSMAYARRLQTVFAHLEGAVARDPDTGRALCEYALRRVLKIYARSDDSAGSIGDQIGCIARLHARACTAAPPGKVLAKLLLSLQQKDEWGLFPLDEYWIALRPDGQADYGRRVLAEFETLPPRPSEEGRWSESFGIARRTEDFARATADFELLQRVLRRRLSSPKDHLRVLESLSEFGRDREALAWAEQAVKLFPRDDGLRGALAECLACAGLDDDAAEQVWQAFRLRPVAENWDLLKRISGAHWPTWRGRMLEHVGSVERGDASHRISLLEHDGDVEAAICLACECEARPDVLARLARHLQRDRPLLAGEFELRIARMELSQLQPTRYAALVATMKRAARCLPAERWRPLVVDIRAEHGRKSKLMRLLDEASL